MISNRTQDSLFLTAPERTILYVLVITAVVNKVRFGSIVEVFLPCQPQKPQKIFGVAGELLTLQ